MTLPNGGGLRIADDPNSFRELGDFFPFTHHEIYTPTLRWNSLIAFLVLVFTKKPLDLTPVPLRRATHPAVSSQNFLSRSLLQK